jgi:hypothetical protein
VGGFALDYVAGSEQVLGSFAADDGNIESDFYVIDETHLLCVLWRSFNSTGESWGLVIDHSDPVTVTFGSLATFAMPGNYTTRLVPTRLTDTDWVLWDEFGGCQRFTVVGNVVTPGAYLSGFTDFTFGSWDGVTGWNHSLWEGHDTEFPQVYVGPLAQNTTERIGLDIDHVLTPGSLSWFDGTGHVVPRWYVLDLTTGGIQPTTEFVPAAGLNPSSIGAAPVAPGLAYWWVWDTYPDDGSPPTGLKLALVDATSTSLSVVEVTGFDFGTLFLAPELLPPLGRNLDDDTFWMASVSNTTLESDWLPTDPWVYTTEMVKVDNVTATTHDYTGEYDRVPPAPSRAYWFDTGRMAGDAGLLTWQVNDTHLRAEVGRSNNYTATAPHDGRHKAGLSHGRLVDIETTAASHRAGDLYGSVYREVGLPPEIDFSIDNDTVNAGDPVTFDAEDYIGGHDSREQSRDSYWHPIDEYRWEWDDGTADTFTGSNPTVHTYSNGSATHAAGSQTADATINFPSQIGDIGYYLPLLRAHNSVGWSYASGTWEIEVDAPPFTPPLRQRGRPAGIGAAAGPPLRQRGTFGDGAPPLRQRGTV